MKPARHPCTDSPPERTRAAPHGLTLIEALVTLGLLALMAAVAVPSLAQQLRKGRRSDAMTALAATVQAQELARASAARYADHYGPGGLEHLSDLSADGHYRLELASVSATGYQATATAVGAQTEDAACRHMRATLDAATGTLRYSSSSDGSTWVSGGSDRCWAQ